MAFFIEEWMQPRKLKVKVVIFCMGANGTYSAITPEIAKWLLKVQRFADADRRIESFSVDYTECVPITMSRNAAVLNARKEGVDVLVMLDSDNIPDYHLGESGTQPFFQSSFNFIYDRYDKGPNVVFAPYCGAPPFQVPFIFKWFNWGEWNQDQDVRLQKYERNEAAQEGGIKPVASGPTGVSMYDMRIFDVAEPPDDETANSWKGWFYYEYPNKYAAEKASTEDVTAFRDISLIGIQKLGYNPLFCNFDAWAAHLKPLAVPKPNPITAEQVSDRFRKAVFNDYHTHEKKFEIGDEQPQFTDSLDFFIDYGVPVSEPGDLKVLERLVGDLKTKLGRAPEVLEIGAWLGKTACTMADAGAIVTCVDPWKIYETSDQHDIIGGLYRDIGEEKVFATFQENIGPRLGKSVRYFRGTSAEAARSNNIVKSFDLVYIDAKHDYESVKQDIALWLPRIRTGGIMAGHDYKQHYEGVVLAVNEKFGDKIQTESQVWWVEDVNAPASPPHPLGQGSTAESRIAYIQNHAPASPPHPLGQGSTAESRIAYIQNHDWPEDVVESNGYAASPR